jgi:hypothetical protein
LTALIRPPESANNSMNMNPRHFSDLKGAK